MDVAAFLKKVLVFNGVSDEYLPEIASALTKRNLQSREILYEQGEEPDTVFVIVRGKVERKSENQ